MGGWGVSAGRVLALAGLRAAAWLSPVTPRRPAIPGSCSEGHGDRQRGHRREAAAWPSRPGSFLSGTRVFFVAESLPPGVEVPGGSYLRSMCSTLIKINTVH